MGKLHDSLTPPLIAFIEAENHYATKLGAEGIRAGQLAANMRGIDGLRGLEQPSL